MRIDKTVSHDGDRQALEDKSPRLRNGVPSSSHLDCIEDDADCKRNSNNGCHLASNDFCGS